MSINGARILFSRFLDPPSLSLSLSLSHSLAPALYMYITIHTTLRLWLWTRKTYISPVPSNLAELLGFARVIY